MILHEIFEKFHVKSFDISQGIPKPDVLINLKKKWESWGLNPDPQNHDEIDPLR